MKNLPICAAVLMLFCVASDAQQPVQPAKQQEPVCTANSVCENDQFTVAYKELGCTPSKVNLPMTCCPISYDCTAALNRPTNVCQYKGANYSENAKLSVSALGVRCMLECTCKKTGTALAWSCTNEVCKPLAPSCVPVYASTTQCCPTCNVTTVAVTPAKDAGSAVKAVPAMVPTSLPAKAPTGTPAKAPTSIPAKAPTSIPAKIPAPAKPAKTSKLVEVLVPLKSLGAKVAATPFKCTINGVEFRQGENMLTDNCMFCLCLPGFDGTQNGTWCAKINCGLDLTYQENIKKGCSPIFEEFTCCPVAWQCPTRTDVIIRVDLTKTTDGKPLPKGTVLPAAAANKCKFGNNTLNWYDGLNLAPVGNKITMCSCYNPPMLTCENMMVAPSAPLPPG